MTEDRTEPPPSAALGGVAEVRFVVGSSQAGERLDAAVSAALGSSRAAARRLVAEGRVRVDGRVARKGSGLAAGAVVTVARPAASALDPVPETGGASPSDHAPGGSGADAGAAGRSRHPARNDGAPGVAIVYEDGDLLAIDKPAGMPSHPLRAGERGTAANFLVGHDRACARASVDPREGGLGHRLDTATSGVLVAARSRSVWRALRTSLASEECEKRYLAEVWGAPPDVGRISAAIGRRGRRGKTVRLDGGRNPQPAETTWTVLERRAETALIEARLHAGRPHQVRAHLAGAGFPIVGDDRYGDHDLPAEPAEGPRARGGPGLRLHAAAITFRHPTTKVLVTLTAPAPAWATVGARPFAV